METEKEKNSGSDQSSGKEEQTERQDFTEFDRAINALLRTIRTGIEECLPVKEDLREFEKHLLRAQKEILNGFMTLVDRRLARLEKMTHSTPVRKIEID